MPPLLLTHDQYLRDCLIEVQVASIVDPCSICQESYSDKSKPVLLSKCGHIFCQSCIRTWFDSRLENANTCPTCREVLFRLPGAGNMTDMYGPVALIPQPRVVHMNHTRVARAARPTVDFLMNGFIIATDGALTHRGCQVVIHDLWYCTLHLIRSIEDFCGEEVSPLDVDIELLRICFQVAIPTGIRCEEDVWELLCAYAKQMLVWHKDIKLASGGWGDEWVPSEELRGFVERLWEFCGNV